MQTERLDKTKKENKNGIGLWPEYAETMIVCFSGIEDGIPTGELWSFYFEHSYPFRGLDGLLFAMECVMDEARKPPVWCERRSLHKKPKDSNAVKRQAFVPQQQLQIPFYRPDELAGRQGQLCTVAVRIIWRQNASMQGELRVPEHDSVRFRSALELLHLLREVLELAAAPHKAGNEVE